MPQKSCRKESIKDQINFFTGVLEYILKGVTPKQLKKPRSKTKMKKGLFSGKGSIAKECVKSRSSHCLQ